MHLQKRKLAGGRVGYYLRYWDDNKNKCVPVRVVKSDPSFKGEYPFPSKELGLEFIRKSKALDDFKRHSEGLSFIKDKNAFVNFNKLRDVFIVDLKRNAPNSYEGNIHYFDHYVLPYFVAHIKEYNINKWFLHFKGYRYWLEASAYKSSVANKKSRLTDQDLISYSTKNHCIRTLNAFLRSMMESNTLAPECNVKCRAFEQHLVDLNARGVEDVIDEIKFIKMRKELEGLCKDPANLSDEVIATIDFFRILYNTGMRFSELYSLSIADIYFEDEVKKGMELWMIDELEKYDYEIFGYIVIKSQMSSKVRQRNFKTGHVARKPLKGRKTMTNKDGRLIPITDFDTMNTLIERYVDSHKDWKSRSHKSSNKSDYFIFKDSETVNVIRKTFSSIPSSSGFHACRHSYVTNLVGVTGNQVLTRAITGHKSISAFDRYLHIYEGLVQKSISDERVNHKRSKLPMLIGKDRLKLKKGSSLKSSRDSGHDDFGNKKKGA